MDKKITLPNEVFIEEVARLLESGRDVTFTPKGNSMLPFIRGDRDSVTLRKFPQVQVGDIVLVRLQDRYVLHRICSKDGDKLVLMGDGNISGTETCTQDDVIGTVTLIHKGSRSASPSKGRVWRTLRPVRRYLLAIYRRIIPKQI